MVISIQCLFLFHELTICLKTWFGLDFVNTKFYFNAMLQLGNIVFDWHKIYENVLSIIVLKRNITPCMFNAAFILIGFDD